MKKLDLLFKAADGSTVTLSVDQPIEPVDPVAVNAAMDEIIAQNVFQTRGGELKRKHAARIVERNVTEIEIEVTE